MSKKSKGKYCLLAVLSTVSIICIAVTCTVFFTGLYAIETKKLNLDSVVGLSYDTLMENYRLLIRYQSIFYRGNLQLPNFIMSTSGRIHFEEVKRLFEVIQVIAFIGVGYLLYISKKAIKLKDFLYFKWTSLLTVGLPSIIGLLASIDFDKSFILFHKIAFRNDYWIFDEVTDPIITVLPESYFMHCFMLIIFLVLVMAGINYFMYRRILNSYLKAK